MSNTFSSAYLRDRDKILEEKHQKELAAVERKVERLKSSNNDTLKQLFDIQTRGNRLARSLGFNDIYEAQVTIDNTDCEVQYKECIERVEGLQAELSSERTKNDKFQEHVKLLEEEREQLQTALAAAEQNRLNLKENASQYKSKANRLSQEVAELQARYDTLADVKERAAARYKVDYVKWRKVRDWLFSEEEHTRDKYKTEVGEEEKKQGNIESIMRRKKIMMEIGLGGDTCSKILTPDPPPPLGGITNFDCDKENQVTPMPVRKKRRLETPTSPSHLPPSSPTIVGSLHISPLSASSVNVGTENTPSLRQFKSIDHTSLSSCHTLFNHSTAGSTRQPLTFYPIHPSPPVDKETGSSPLASDMELPPSPGRAGPLGSSDTEDDSQAEGHFPAPFEAFNAPTSPAISPVMMNSSQTEPESQSQIFPFGGLTPFTPNPIPKPSSELPESTPQSRSSGSSIISHDTDGLQLLKIQRSSAKVDPLPSPTPESPKLSTANGESSSKIGRDKPKEVKALPSTPLNTTGLGIQKRLDDYSAFKGRGRYAKEICAKDSINAQYVIDPTHNGGLDFQYDEVVRGKSDRKRMIADDCECCRGYYEAVGPLPNRLRQPLWRSPPATPAKPCTRHQQHLSTPSLKNARSDAEKRHSEISSHKQAISRHRQHWARAKTPPGYWDIGFPDTQEAANINAQAREMHEKKRAEIVAAANGDGARYKKR